MAECLGCGKKIGFLNRAQDGVRCVECYQKFIADQTTQDHDSKISQDALNRKREQALRSQLDSIMVTTETYINKTVLKRIKVIVATAESSFDAKVSEKHNELIHSLKTEAHAVGANAILGVSFSIVETYATTVGFGELKRFKMVAFGTAVELEN